MPLPFEAEPLPLPHPWKPSYWEYEIGVLKLPLGYADAHFGPPGVEHPLCDPEFPESDRYWGFHFRCGLECVIAVCDRPNPKEPGVRWAEVFARPTEVDHILRHLNFPKEWIDSVVSERKPETWSVWRQDDYGNQFHMCDAVSEREAKCLADTFERRGHKQMYWAQPRARES